MQLQGRTNGLIHSPIGEAFALLAAHTPKRSLLNLSQAAPSFPPAPQVADRVAEVAYEEDGARYVPQEGLPGLRTALAAELTDLYPGTVSVDNILITAGCNQAFCVVASALTIPGDNLIVALPYYFNHDMWLEVEGVERRYLEPDSATLPAMAPTVADAAALIDDRTRAIVLVSPGNPSGVTLSPQLLADFFDLCVEHNIMLVLDETYRSYRGSDLPAHDLYDRPNWADHLVTLQSFSKDLAIPGYRVGAVVGSRDALAEAMKLVDCIAICAPRIGQEAALAGLLHAGEWRSVQAARIQERHQQFRAVMADSPGGFELVSSGAYFGWVRHPYANTPTLQVVADLLSTKDILVIPGTAFTPTDQQMLRFSFANLSEPEIDELARRLAE
ncbi:aminotransferase [bacterium]|nr:aminotransferase [bacterium]